VPVPEQHVRADRAVDEALLRNAVADATGELETASADLGGFRVPICRLVNDGEVVVGAQCWRVQVVGERTLERAFEEDPRLLETVSSFADERIARQPRAEDILEERRLRPHES